MTHNSMTQVLVPPARNEQCCLFLTANDCTIIYKPNLDCLPVVVDLFLSTENNSSASVCNIVLLSTAKQGDNALGSVRLFVCLFVCVSVCLSDLSCLNRLTYDLDFWYGVRP